MNPNAYLRLMFRQWQMTRRIPGTKKRLVVNLGTGDIVEARRRRDQVWAEFMQQRQKTNEEVALQLAEEYDADHEDLSGAISDWAQGLEDKVGEKEAIRLYKIATRQHTSVTAYLDAFFVERPCAPNTKMARAMSIRQLPFKYIEDVDQKAAGQYVSKLATTKRAGTVNGQISHVRVYWDFLKSKGIVKFNPWVGQSVRRDRRQQVGSAVWTFPEVRRMLQGVRSELRLLLTVLLYSGCRIGELANLRAEHLFDSGFRVVLSKTTSGARTVYLKRSLVEAMAVGSGYVFLPQRKAQGARGRAGDFSNLVSAELRRLFPHYKGDQRNSEKTTHGIRKLWATVAEEEGIPVHLWETAGGWKRTGVALTTYSAGPSQSQVREVFARVAQRLDSELMSGEPQD